MDALPRSRRRSPHAVSVAELLCRDDGAPAVPRPRPASDPVPVSALLRREGRARHALDRPLVPRGHSRPDPGPAGPPPHGVRRAAAAAGALFVVGAVFGAGVLEESLPRPVPGPEAGGAGGVGSTGIGAAAVRSTGSAAALTPGTGLLPAPDDPPPVTGADIGAAALPPVAGPGTGTADPGPGDTAPGHPAPAAPGPAAPAGPGGRAVVEVPDPGTPPVGIPGIALPPTPLGPAATPAATLTRAGVVTPTLTASVDRDGLVVGTTGAAVVSPDLAIGALGAGPVGLPGAGAGVGDLRIADTEPLRAGPEPEVTVPAVTLTPGPLDVALADLSAPGLSTPEVAVVGTVSGLLG